jgi:glutathionylspermidine synthase
MRAVLHAALRAVLDIHRRDDVMRRIPIAPRKNWIARCEAIGFNFHTIDYGDGTDPMYWDERAYYQFTATQIDLLESVSDELNQMCLHAVAKVIEQRRFAEFHIPEAYHEMIVRSWQRKAVSLYGRFDLVWDGSETPPKLLEFNADTPTSLYEASVVQWQWLNEMFPQADQFNSIHEKLLSAWQKVQPRLGSKIYFAVVRDSIEDEGTVEYLRDTAIQTGIDAPLLHLDEIGWNGKYFTDLNEQRIDVLFKLYPWEWLLREPIGEFLLREKLSLIEPAWRMILSNKAILPILWEMYPNHPNLLPAYFSPEKLGDTYVEKPILSREGGNVRVVIAGETHLSTSGFYADEPKVYQAYQPLPNFEQNYPILGSWIIDGQACGLGIREDHSPITANSSRFLPHLFLE